MNEYKKIKTGIALPQNTVSLMDRHLQDCKCTSRNELVDKAIREFIKNKIRSLDRNCLGDEDNRIVLALKELETHQARILYKIAVELAQLTFLLVDELDVDMEIVKAYRGKAVALVNETKGIVALRNIDGR